MDYLEALEKKIEQYNKDLKLIIEASKKLDKISTAKIKSLFEDLIVDSIKDFGERVSSLKEFVREEKKKNG